MACQKIYFDLTNLNDEAEILHIFYDTDSENSQHGSDSEDASIAYFKTTERWRTRGLKSTTTESRIAHCQKLKTIVSTTSAFFKISCYWLLMILRKTGSWHSNSLQIKLKLKC